MPSALHTHSSPMCAANACEASNSCSVIAFGRSCSNENTTTSGSAATSQASSEAFLKIASYRDDAAQTSSESGHVTDDPMKTTPNQDTVVGISGSDMVYLPSSNVNPPNMVLSATVTEGPTKVDVEMRNNGATGTKRLGGSIPAFESTFNAIHRILENAARSENATQSQVSCMEGHLRSLLKLLLSSHQLIETGVVLNTLQINANPRQILGHGCSEGTIDQLQEPELGTVLEGTTYLWASVLQRLHSALSRVWRGRYKKDLAEWNARLSHIWRNLNLVKDQLQTLKPAWMVSRKQGMCEFMEYIYQIFLELYSLVCDVDVVLRMEAKPNSLAFFGAVYSRHTIITELVASAPKRACLKKEVEATIDAMEPDSRRCAICLESWDGEAFRNNLSVLQNLVISETPQTESDKWLWVDQKQSERFSFTVRPGFEGVPLQMGCGHIFCAGCASTFLRQTEGWRCPFRDETYGIFRFSNMDELVQRLRGKATEYEFEKQGWDV